NPPPHSDIYTLSLHDALPIYTCLYPTGVTINNITQTGADISWTGSTSTSVTAYEYEVRSSGTPGSGTPGLDATGITTNATITSRSEEHTSELQSRENLVCRLL